MTNILCDECHPLLRAGAGGEVQGEPAQVGRTNAQFCKVFVAHYFDAEGKEALGCKPGEVAWLLPGQVDGHLGSGGQVTWRPSLVLV